ncbi:DNA polymerase III catalytic subunit DnaE type [Mycoplasma testudineum]|uniref:DNA-directed DNA polymerase n=1 Tax=Mycoplasma testudineum TaxID=244584 RepID=A0A4R6ID46_9MOLU|nr:DNA polymerase III subunit alpha [Mycoplasma testudineum]OYD26786.1 hypothetical protein CG473_02420 [Mycoplasma testudineum]TDO19922.1 DNA polymerase III catalytic subunit DnaE type [Mycoplasma testudineum]
MNNFINLHLNTEFSFLDSTIRISDLISFAKNNGLKKLVITDHNNLNGLDTFYYQCKANDISPIAGLEADIEGKKRIILIAKNNSGLQKLYLVILKIQVDGFITLKDLKVFEDDLIFIDHPRQSFKLNSSQINENNFKNFYLSDGQINVPNSLYVNENKIMFSDEQIALEILNSTAGNNDNQNIKFTPLDNGESVDMEMKSRISDLVKDIEINLHKADKFMPSFDIKSQVPSDKILENKLNELLNKRGHIFKDFSQAKLRLEYELKVINNLGYADYFLNIAEIIDYAKSTDIEVGPGRGSAAGSLVSFLLDITTINPLEYGLLFERFLNPERVSLPDIDIDIQDDKRDILIKQYILPRYGANNVATITTYSYLAAKSSLRDIDRYLHKVEDPNSLSKSNLEDVSKALDPKLNLSENLKQNKKLFKIINKGSGGQNLEKAKIEYNLMLAQKIEGLPRQTGTHAAGIIISDKPLVENLPLSIVNDMYQIQYDMTNLEKLGFLKIDFLGLKTLSTIKSIKELIQIHHPEIYKNLKLNPADFSKQKDLIELVQSGDTLGIFQIESHGMTTVFQKSNISEFKDIYDIISLYRPGPMEYIDNYIENKKNPSKIEKISPEYDKILASTHGIIVYQEQIMEIAQKVSGLNFAKADILRRAIGKKDATLLKSLKQQFVDGALNNGFEISTIEKIFKNIEMFANYGFNKSHAVAYATIAYEMIYYKAKFPLFFYTSLIKTANGDQKKINAFANEAIKRGIKVSSPNVNFPDEENSLIGDVLHLPLTMIKSFGPGANDKLVEDYLNNGKYTNFFNFVVRARFAGLTETNIKRLIWSSALRDFGTQSQCESWYDEAELMFKEKQAILKLSPNAIVDFSDIYQDQSYDEKTRLLNIEIDNEVENLGQAYNNYSQESNLLNLGINKEAEISVQILSKNYFKTPPTAARQFESIILKFKDKSVSEAIMWCNKSDQSLIDLLEVNNKYKVIVKKIEAKNKITFKILKVISKENNE